MRRNIARRIVQLLASRTWSPCVDPALEVGTQERRLTAVLARVSILPESVEGLMTMKIKTFALNTKIAMPLELDTLLVAEYSNALSPMPLTA